MRVAFDTNFLLYAEGFDDPLRRDMATELLGRIPADRLVIPAQVLAEFGYAMRRKGGKPAEAVRRACAHWEMLAVIPPSTGATVMAAMELLAQHQIPVFDGVILAASMEAGCQILLSEDFHHGFAWQGVTVVNPFREPDHPLLRRAQEW